MRETFKDDENDAEKLFQEKVKLKYKIQILMKNKLKSVNKLNTLMKEKGLLERENDKLKKLMGLNQIYQEEENEK